MIEFRKVTRDNLAAVCALDVAPNQRGLVTANVMTMAEANFEPGAWIRAVWRGGKPVGLLAMLRPSAYPQDEDIVIRRDAAYVWRLMIDERFQGQGLGRQALDQAKQVAKDWGYEDLTLTVGGGPHSAIPFYQAYGFQKTGRILWEDVNEIEMIYRFAP